MAPRPRPVQDAVQPHCLSLWVPTQASGILQPVLSPPTQSLPGASRPHNGQTLVELSGPCLPWGPFVGQRVATSLSGDLHCSQERAEELPLTDFK